MKRLVIFLLFILLAGSANAAQIINDEEYWGFPEYVPDNSPYGGFYHLWGNSNNVVNEPLVELMHAGQKWRDMNPSEGVYDWYWIDGTDKWHFYPTLEEIAAQNKKAIFWMPYFEYIPQNKQWMAPDWVIQKCNPSEILNADEKKFGLAVWEDCPKAELVKFIRALNRYHDNNSVQFAYITMFKYGEFHMQQENYIDAQNKGLTGEVLKSFCKDIIDAWVYALGKEKLIWLSEGSMSGSSGDLKTASQWCSTYALETVGTNIRGGIGESLSTYTESPILGLNRIHIEGNKYYLNYQTVDNILDGIRFFGDEFEEENFAGYCSDEIYGADECQDYSPNYDYFRLALLNMQRSGRNYITNEYHIYEPAFDNHAKKYKDLFLYFRQSAGYPINESPDAWAILQAWAHDWKCYSPADDREYHNFEKFLIQREVVGGKTVLVEKKDYFNRTGFCKNRNDNYVYHARRTDRATGNDFIYFNLDDKFNARKDMQISVYYKDNSDARWMVEYNSLTGDYKKTETVQNANDGKWKSAIFNISDSNFGNAQTGGMDFRIYNGGSKDVTVGSVRVIRSNSSNPVVPSAPAGLSVK